MPTEILMPALSPTMEEGTLAKWLVKEGDEVSSGDILAEIETDKATMEFEAVDEGTIGKILISEGSEGVKVNTPIAVLLEEGESADDIDSSAGSVAERQATLDQNCYHRTATFIEPRFNNSTVSRTFNRCSQFHHFRLQ